MSEKLSVECYIFDELIQELEVLDLEIVCCVVICQVCLFDLGVLNQVMDNNEQVCGQVYLIVFQSLCGLFYLYFDMYCQLVQIYGVDDVEYIIQCVYEYL